MVTQSSISLKCSLCGLKLSKYPIIDGDEAFCCPGCQAVFRILSTKNELDNFEENPLFHQAVKSGLISNPELIESLRGKTVDVPEDEWQKIHLEIQEMWCPSCAEIIRLVLLQEKGVKNCIVDYTTDLAVIEFTPRYLSKERLFQLISSLGYVPRNLEDRSKKAVSFSLYLRFIIATFCALNIMMFAYPLYAPYFDGDTHAYAPFFAWASFFLSLPLLTYCAYPIFQRCFNGLKVGIVGMETLVSMGVSAAFSLSLYTLLKGGTHVYFDSMSVIIAFVLLGKIIEAKAKFSTKDALIRLSLALPRRGRKRFKNGEEAFVLMKEIEVGDEIVTLSGEKIVLDGVIMEGEGICDESIMTGEALPVAKEKGDHVIGGSILQKGKLTIRVTHHPDETALQKIVEMVQQDMGHKSNYTRAVDPFVRYFVPAVILIACCVGYLFSIPRAIAVLLISCPCAIGIAAPLAESGIINGMAKLGAILRNRAALPFIGKETLIAFDKTGTLTEGKFSVLSGLKELSDQDAAALKAMTKESNHPISCSIHQSLRVSHQPLEKAEEITSQGVRAFDQGNQFLLGSYPFLEANHVKVPKERSDTCVAFAKNGTCLSVISLGDKLRKEAPSALASLQPVKMCILSGDGEQVVAKVAEKCGLKSYFARLSPLQKREFIEKKKEEGEIVAMLGDGINDAAALTSAHVGISVVSASDISIQVSDILLTTESLHAYPSLRKLARRGKRIIYQNLFWAFFYNIIGIGLAVAGYLTPLFSAAAMVISSLIVIFNSKRLMNP